MKSRFAELFPELAPVLQDALSQILTDGDDEAALLLGDCLQSSARVALFTNSSITHRKAGLPHDALRYEKEAESIVAHGLPNEVRP